MNQDTNDLATATGTPKLSLPAVTTSTGFTFPSIYSFPPFFTKQPNPQTWAHQASLWQQLVISYCRFHRTFKFELGPSVEDWELFHNRSISRRLRLEAISEIVEMMVQAGTAEYYPSRPGAGSQKSTTPTYAIIHFNPVSHWANLIYNHITSHGLTNSVMTLHELSSDDAGEELAGLDPIVLRKALAVLVKQGKAKMFKGTVDGVGGDTDGVKFF